jgi:hypothetical protein
VHDVCVELDVHGLAVNAIMQAQVCGVNANQFWRSNLKLIQLLESQALDSQTGVPSHTFRMLKALLAQWYVHV